MSSQGSVTFVYESKRYADLMLDYQTTPETSDYKEWSMKAIDVGNYMHQAIVVININLLELEKAISESDDPARKNQLTMVKYQYRALKNILLEQIKSLIAILRSKNLIPEDRSVVKFLAFEQNVPHQPLDADSPYLRVFILNDGQILLDGVATTLAELKLELQALVQKKGVVLYSRENIDDPEPPAIAESVIKCITENSLPVCLCRRRDFSDVLDENGKLRVTGR